MNSDDLLRLIGLAVERVGADVIGPVVTRIMKRYGWPVVEPADLDRALAMITAAVGNLEMENQRMSTSTDWEYYRCPRKMAPDG